MEKLRLKETSIPPQHQHQHQHHNGNLNQTCGAEEQGQLGAALSEAILSVSSPPRRYGHHHRHRRQGLNCNPQIFEGEEFKQDGDFYLGNTGAQCCLTSKIVFVYF